MIRDAVAADAEAIAAIWNPFIRDTVVTFTNAEKSAEDIRVMIRQRQSAGRGFLVADSGGLLGFATYDQFRAGPGYARSMEHTVLLAPAARGRGVGRVLMADLCDHAARAGAHILMAGVSAANPAGVAFHAAIGFREVGRVLEAGWKFGRYHDLVLMQKILSDPVGKAETAR